MDHEAFDGPPGPGIPAGEQVSVVMCSVESRLGQVPIESSDVRAE
jgi:hypothetical protein